MKKIIVFLLTALPEETSICKAVALWQRLTELFNYIVEI